MTDNAKTREFICPFQANLAQVQSELMIAELTSQGTP